MTHNALIVGCGAIGSQLDEGTTGSVALTHATGYKMHGRTRLVAGVDPDPDRLSAFSAARSVAGYTDIETAVAEHDVDIVSVCTPPETHADVIDTVLNADVEAILCEKPIAADSETGERIVSACSSVEIPLIVNYFRRYLPGCQLARAMLRSGIVGTDRRAVLVYNKGFLNNGSHVVDLARWWFGEATELQASGSHQPDGVVTFGQTRCHLVHVGNAAYNHIQADVYGDGGRLQLLDHGRRIAWQPVSDSTLFDGFSELGTATEIATGLEWMCYFVVDDLVTAIEQSAPPACDGETALRTLKLCERFGN